MFKVDVALYLTNKVRPTKYVYKYHLCYNTNVYIIYGSHFTYLYFDILNLNKELRLVLREFYFKHILTFLILNIYSQFEHNT